MNPEAASGAAPGLGASAAPVSLHPHQSDRLVLLTWINDMLSHIQNFRHPLPSPPAFLKSTESSEHALKTIMDAVHNLAETAAMQNENLRLQHDAIDELSREKDEREKLRSATIQVFLLEERDAILAATLDIFSAIVEIVSAEVFLLDADAGTWNPIWQLKSTPEFQESIRKQREAGIFDWVVKSRSTMALPPSEDDSGRTLILTPMIVGHRAAGLVCVLANFPPDQITPYHSENLLLLASQAGAAVENANLFARIVLMKQYNESILDNMTNGILAVSPDGRVTTFNKAMEEMLKLRAGDVLHQPLSARPILPVFEPFLAKATNAPERMFHEELRITDPSIGEKVLDLRTSCVVNERGEVTAVIMAATDMTQVRELEKQVARSDRLASLGMVAAGTAHEIRNPLSAIRGTMQLLNRKLKKLEQTDLVEKVDSVLEEVARINGIVGQMMELSKDAPVELKSEDPVQIVRDVIGILDGMFHETQTVVDLSLDEAVPRVDMDSSEIKQVLLNLMQNAIHAMGTKGTLSVSVANTIDGRVSLRVKDSGPGIPQEYLDKIFEPFFTTKDEGTGLGLSISDRIIKEHGGEMKVESVAGQGATFTILLPPVSEAALAETALAERADA